MSSISSSLRLFPPKLSQNLPFRTKPSIYTTPFLSSSKPIFFSATITFQSLSKPSLHQPIKSQQQQDQQQQQQPVELSLLPKNLQDIITLFQSVEEPKAKYHQLLHYSSKLPPLDPQYKSDENRVRGCVSQVWVRAFPDPDDPSAVRFEADSDSALTKGLAALLVLGLSGSPAPMIARVPPDFVHMLGLRQSLTPSRNNGFLNMLKLMQQKALQLYAQDADSVIDRVSEAKDSNLDGNVDGINTNSVVSEALGTNGSGGSVTNQVVEGKRVNLDINGDRVGATSAINGATEVEIEDLDGNDNIGSSSGGGLGGRAERIRGLLERELHPVELEVEDISHLHAGHAGIRGSSGGETHFNVKVVSKEFEGKSMVKRHRLVYALLQEELQSGLHALSIVAKTPSEVYLS